MEKIKIALFPNKDNPLEKGDAPLQPWAEAKYRAANSEALHVVGRIRRMDHETLVYKEGQSVWPFL